MHKKPPTRLSRKDVRTTLGLAIIRAAYAIDAYQDTGDEAQADRARSNLTVARVAVKELLKLRKPELV